MSAAVDAREPDARHVASSRLRSSSARPRLHVQSLRMLRDVKLNGGYQLGDEVGLLIEARNGIGCIERGPILFSRDGAYRSKAGDNLVRDPVTT